MMTIARQKIVQTSYATLFIFLIILAAGEYVMSKCKQARWSHDKVGWDQSFQSQNIVINKGQMHSTVLVKKPARSKVYFLKEKPELEKLLFISKVEKILKSYPGFNPITFIFSENSNSGRESLLEV